MKLTKILVVVLTLSLLIGSAVAVMASADDADSYDVKAINIAYGDRVQVLIAVDAPLALASEISVNYTIAGTTREATYWGDDNAVTIDGVAYPVFYTAGISPKDSGESVLVEAHEKGSAVASPVYTDASVAQYLYTMLYREGYVNASEPKDVDRRDFYFNALEYIASAQKVLWNNKEENVDKQRVPVTERIYVYADDAVIGSAGNSALLDAQGNVKLTYTGRDLFLGWNVITSSGSELVKNNTVFISESARIEPAVIVKPAGEDFESAPTSKTEAAITSGSTVYNYTFASGMTISYPNVTNEGPSGAQGTVVEIVEENGNKYLHVNSPGRNAAQTDRAPSITIDAQNHSGFHFNQNANVAIFEFDIKASSAAKFQDISFTAGVAVSDNGYGYGGVKFATNGGDWVNVRIEGYKAEKMVQVYVDGALAGSFGMPESSADARMRYVYLNLTNGSGAFDVSYDNINVYHVDKTYEAVPTLTPTVQDFSGEYTAETVTQNGGDTVTFAQFYNVIANMDSASRTNSTGLAGTSVITKNGNKMFRYYTPGRINPDGSYNDTNRAPVFKILAEKLVGDSTANTTVFEFTLNLNDKLPEGEPAVAVGSKLFNVSFGNNTKGDEIHYSFNYEGGVISLGGITLGRAGEDIDVKFVYSGHTTDRTASRDIEVYANGSLAGTLTLDAASSASCSTKSEIWGRIGTMDRVRFTGEGSGMIDLTIDNLKAYTTYVAE